MARRKRSGGRRGRSFGGRAGFGAIIDGGLGGAAASFGARVIGPDYGPAVGLAVAGMWRRNPTLQTLAGVELGASIANRVNVPGLGTGTTGGVL